MNTDGSQDTGFKTQLCYELVGRPWEDTVSGLQTQHLSPPLNSNGPVEGGEEVQLDLIALNFFHSNPNSA